MLEIFTDNWDDVPVLSEDEHLVHILTGSAADYLLAIVDDSVDDVDDELARALRRRHGRHAAYCGYEDVTEVYATHDSE